MSLNAAHKDALLRIVGDAGWVDGEAERARYEAAARYGSGRAAAIVRPADVAQVSTLVGYMVREGLSFVTQAAHTGLVLGATPSAGGDEIVLSVDRLRAPLKIDVADRTIEAAAGMRLSEVNAALAAHGFCLPIDLGADPLIGGMAGANTGGARFLRYGDVRRHLLGVEAVLANAAGEVVSFSSGLRKDNTRLALGQLLIGSCGTLGVITRVTLEARVQPQQRACALLIPRDEAAVLELLAVFEREAGDHLSAFEGMSGAAMACALAHAPALRNPFPDETPPLAVLVELSAASSARAGAVNLDLLLGELLSELMEQGKAPLADAMLARGEEFWALRHALSEGLRAAGRVLGFDLAFTRGALFAFRRAAYALLEAEFPNARICDFGHIGDGGLHFNLLLEGDWSEARVEALREAVLDLAVGRFGGSFSGEHGLGRANQRAYDAYTPLQVRSYAAAIADIFAPQRKGPFRLGLADQTQRSMP